MAQEVSEYLSQNPRVAAWVEALRCDGETDKHWRHRRDFLLRNAGDLAPVGGAASASTDEAADAESGTRNRQLQQLISFSMAWANHVFLGCRYPQKVMDKILSMAEGIKVTDAPTYTTRDELVAKVKKRGISSSNEGVEEPSKKRVIEGKNSSAVEQDHAKTSAKTERASAQQENSSAGTGAAIKSESGNSARSAGISSQNSSTSDGDRSVSSQSSSSVSSQVTTAGSGKASEAEAPDKHGSASFVSLLKSSVNSHMTQSTDSRQQGGSPKKSALEGSSASASQSSSEIEVPLLGSSGSSEVELPLLSSKPSSETASSGLTSKTSSEASVSSSVAKNSSSSGTSLLTPKSSSSTNTSLLTSKSTSQVAASLLASKSSSQTSGSLVSKSTSLASVSQLASKSSSQTSTSQLPSKSTSQSSESAVKFSCKLTNEDVKQKQPFFNRLYKTVAWKLVAVGGFSPNVNHGELLNAAIEALKATLDVFFVPLKELADLPQNKSSQESIVCELRCKSVYLGTGCGKSKENAKAVASREALKLFLKKKVVVKICKRKYRGSEIEDLVLLDEESRPVNLPPALKHPQELL
ncbi:PREDICTED: CDKN2A-interacting protein isoform X1 [Mandrillus leucophaeus]|uniref:CDKN2A interacting protein n=1 Tax=Mandrillus leucophaeus TaxID=9568 RepID=A0A2K5Z1B6_MANLE|nr:PREDICTED: CDKN2A-interacting protein isoform X1 [Mandrillus leucophaeus]